MRFAGCGCHGAAPVVVNGSFESPLFSSVGGFGYTTAIDGWTPVEAAAIGVNTGAGPFHDNGVIPTGDQVLLLQAPETQVAGVVQTVAGFEAGKDYTLIMYVNARGIDDPFASLEVLFDGNVVYGPTPWTAGGYQRLEIPLGQPGAGSFDLQISAAIGNTNGPTLLVDGVTIVETGGVESYILNGWPQLAPFVDTPPVQDGTISANEYGPFGNKPVDVRLGSLNALNNSDPSGRPFRQNGTYLQAGGTIDSDADASFVAYYAWDANALYFAAVVQDDIIAPETATNSVNLGDTVQLCLDYDNISVTNGTDVGTVFIPSWAPVDNTSDFSHFNAFWPTSSPNPFTGTTWNMTVGSGSYTLEARIPWTAFTAGGATFSNAFPPSPGDTMGVLPMVLDRESVGGGAPAAFLYTAGNGGNVIGNPTAYSTLSFIESTASAGEAWNMYQ